MPEKTNNRTDESSSGKEMGQENDNCKLKSTSMTYQYYRTLRILYQKAIAQNLQMNQGIKEEVEEILYKKKEKNWALAQEAEALLVELLDEETLRVELCRRMSEVEGIDNPATKKFYHEHSCSELNTAGQGEDENKVHVYPMGYLRRFYGRLINDLQWQSNKDFTVRGLFTFYVNNTKEYFVKTVITFFAFLVISLIFAKDILPVRLTIKAEEWALAPEIILVIVQILQTIIHWILIATAGALGAAFSIVSTQIELHTETIKSMRLKQERSNIKARIWYGAGAAIILFLLLQAKFIEGAIFDLITPAEDRGVLDVARIGVLGVIAGFSEQMVSGILNDAARKAKVKNSGNENEPEQK